MTGASGVARWSLCAAVFLLGLSGETEGAARFLGHVPHDDRPLPHDLDDSSGPNHDADVKLPGRHYPKLPYALDDPYYLPSYTRPRHHHHQPSKSPGPLDHPAGSPDYDFYGRVVTEPPFNDYWEEGDGWGEDGDHYLKSPQSDTSGVSPSAGTPAPPREPSPRFDRTQPRSVTVQAGKTAVLVCRVLNLGDKSVSWIRHEDLHILTVDKYKYSTDERLSVVHDEAEHEWLLKVQRVAQEDAGMYECQVSTKPLLSFIVSLEVVDAQPSTTPFPSLRDAEEAPTPSEQAQTTVPSATILNGPEIHVHRGSLINLTCVVEHTTERPLYVVWYHYNEVIDYENVGGMVVVTHSGHKTVSHLLVKAAESKDSGKYRCQPSNGEDAWITLHVLNGEHPGALQTNGGRRGVTSSAATAVSALLLLLHLYAPC